MRLMVASLGIRAADQMRDLGSDLASGRHGPSFSQTKRITMRPRIWAQKSQLKRSVGWAK